MNTKMSDEEIVAMTCRGCYGRGDGLCRYHERQFQRLSARIKRRMIMVVLWQVVIRQK